MVIICDPPLLGLLKAIIHLLHAFEQSLLLKNLVLFFYIPFTNFGAEMYILFITTSPKGAVVCMNLLFFLTPKQDVLYICEDFTLRQTLEKWSNQRYATIPVLKRNGEYVGTITEGDILWGMKTLHGLDLEASEDVPIASFPRRRDYKAVTVTTDMRTLVAAAVDQNFVPVVDDRNVFIGIVPRTAIIKYMLRRMDASSETTQISTRAIRSRLAQNDA